MPNKTQTLAPQQVPLKEHVSYMLPECASLLATLVEQMRSVSDDLKEISSTIYGNGHTGLKQQAEDNRRNIAEILKIIGEINLTRKEELSNRSLEQQHRETLAEERRKDIKKWWLGIVAAVIVAVIAIVQDVTTQAALMRLMQK